MIVGCVGELELIFVLDSSYRVYYEDFEKAKKFITDLVITFGIAQDAIRVGLVQFGEVINTAFDLETFDTREAIIEAVNNLARLGGPAMLAEGIDAMQRMFETKSRPGVARIGIVLAGGNFQNSMTAKIAAGAARDLGTMLLAVGVGRFYKQEELECITADATKTFNVYDVTKVANLTNSIAQIACRKFQSL